MKKTLYYLLLFLNLVIILYFWWTMSGNLLLNSPTFEITYIVLGRITGLLAVFFVLLQFLVIGRVKWIEKEFGFDKLAIAHHWFGVTAVVFIILHLIFLLIGYSRLYGVTLWQQFLDFNFQWDDLLPATGALLLFVIITISSITIAKKRLKYELWYYVHLIAYLAVLMAFGHQLEVGFDLRTNNLFSAYWILLYLFVGANYVVYRLLWQFYNFYKFRFYVSSIEQENKDTVSIYIKGNNIQDFKYNAGQFIIIRFLDKKNVWQSHPFSISCEPNSEYLRVTVKNLGDFSGKIKEMKIGTKVVIDGPNGIFTEKKNNGNKILFIAGGVGITPILPMLQVMLKKGKDVFLLYSIRQEEHIIFAKELTDLAEQHPDKFKIEYIIKEKNSAHGFQRIDQTCISCLVPDVMEREVYLCGPSAMSLSMKKHLLKLKVNKRKIYYEKFSF